MSNKKIMLIFPVMLLLLSAFVLAGGFMDGIGLPPDEDNEEQPPQIPISKLEIIKVNAEIDGKTDTIQSSGETISKEAKQESDVNFEIEVKNIFDKEIRNIKVSVTIKNIDDGDDLEKESEISKLAPGDSKNVDVKFNLPLKVDEDNYNVKIDVEGKDEDNNLHIVYWILTLKVEKEKNNVVINKASISPSSISCGGITELKVNVLNLGREEENVEIEVMNDYLGIDIREKNIKLGTGTDDDAEYEKAFRLDIPQGIAEGTYSLQIKVYYNKGRFARTKDVSFVIEDCKQTKQKGSNVLVKTTQQGSQQITGTAQQKTPLKETTIAYNYNEPLLLLLTITFIILIGLIIFLIGAIVIKLKR